MRTKDWTSNYRECLGQTLDDATSTVNNAKQAECGEKGLKDREGKPMRTWVEQSQCGP